jgi:hypothetical protein
MDALPVERRWFEREEFSNVIFQRIKVVEFFISKVVLQGPEKVVVRGGEVRGIRWVRDNFPSKLQERVASDFR